MAEPTEADREKATRLAREVVLGNPAAWVVTHLTFALAEERERARAPFVRLFSGGPDTACRTTWPKDGCGGRIECVEVPMADLRAAFEEMGQ